MPFSISTVFVGRIAFVIHVERSAASGHGAVIDHRAFVAGDALVQQARERRGLLAIEVGFQAVTDRFVQQDSRPSRTEHHFHLARRGFARVELNDRLPCCFLGEMLRRCLALEVVQAPRVRRRPALPRAEPDASDLAMQKTLMRASGCESSAKLPSEPITRMRRNSSA